MVTKTSNADSVPKTANLPPPRQGKAGTYKLIFLALLSLCLLASAAFWLTLSAKEKETYRNQAADYMDNLLGDTPLASLSGLIRPQAPPLPERVVHPATEKGTLSGQSVSATIASPPDFGETGAASSAGESGFPLSGLLAPGQQEQPVMFDQEPVPQVTEDSRLRASLLAELARWLASRYRPGPQGGIIAASIQALNQECGVKLAGQAQGGRSGLLRYAFHPSMIQGLYRLYIERFMSDLNQAAQNKGMDAAQNRQFHRALAGRSEILAASLAGVLRVPELGAKLARIDNLAQKSVDANAELATAVFDLDEVRASKASRQVVATGQMRVDGAAARYRRASSDHAQAQSALAAEIRRYSGQNTDEETTLFLAAWVARRYAQGGEARGAIESCIAVLRDFSARCARFGEGA